ncbi:hypothetical protein [Agromyces italicus]|uniref:hypothetical protein n=1 Tax=Agromyces italicus TaxID=279572 RepID=UPI0012FB09E7|nr:hypothetical protein [Agromyces italicus]
MTDTAASVRTATPAAWVTLLLRVRGLMLSGAFAAIVYGMLTNANRTACPTPTGGLSTAQCETYTLGPSGIVVAAMAIALLAGLGAATRRTDAPAALRALDRTGIVIIAIALGSVVISLVWFWLLPVQQVLDHGGSLWFPFPFGSVTSDFDTAG